MRGLGNRRERHQLTARDGSGGVFIGLADIDQANAGGGRQQLVEFIDRNGRDCGHGAVGRGVCLWIRDVKKARTFAAERAIGIRRKGDLAKAIAQGIVAGHVTDRRFADTGDQLDRFHRLHAAHDARESADHSRLCATRHRAGSGEFRQEATVARSTPMRGKDGHLPFKLLNRGVDQWDLAKKCRIIGEKARGEIVRAIDDHIAPFAER